MGCNRGVKQYEKHERPTFTDYLETMTYLMLDLQDIMNTLFSTCFWQSESV